MRALEGRLGEAELLFTRAVSIEIGDLTSVDLRAVVLFVSHFELADWLPIVVALRACRPALGLVLMGGREERAALQRAFDNWASAPLMLHVDSSPSLVLEAISIASDGACTEDLAEADLPTASLEALQRKAAPLARLLATQGPVQDHDFDRFLPLRERAASMRFWTPLDVVERAMAWLRELGVRSVVDVGSGVGKFCVAGALTSSCSFIGVEQRPRLAVIARNVSRMFGVEERVSIVNGRFGEIVTPRAECYYFYNPFEENLFAPQEALDNDVELSVTQFRRDLRAFRTLAERLPLGGYVLTYNGVGGRWPACLDELRVDRELPAVMRLLQKVRH